ncbi:MAG TPA: alpha/beta hydrolase domain-containing protein [Acidimicrobiia bacterium]|nr:alpha/beta hydrolase domain-containing protein [Acidimicrobiia bacterium]
MGALHRSLRLIALAVVIIGAGTLSSCSSSDDSASDTPASTTTVPFAAESPTEITSPPAKGTVNLPQPAAPVPENYVQEEFFVGGTATRFDAKDTPEDGKWTAAPTGEEKYRTRVIVRHPKNAADFSGTVLLEWFNVSALEASPDWALMNDEIIREGHAYIGVSAQKQGVEGGGTLLEVEVDPEQAASLGETAPSKSGLKKIDPARYGTLVHPGDAYAYDIFSQVGRAVDQQPAKLLGDLKPKQVIAAGESQSAAFMTTLVNAVHPLAPTFDGFLIHSRGANGAPIDGKITRGDGNEEDESGIASRAILVRTDLDVPVFMFETETDLTLLQYSRARQPDTDLIRTWEVAGTSHADAHFIRSIVGGPRDPNIGSLLKCEDPINTGPQHEVLQAGLNQLVAWIADGTPPPAGTRIELASEDPAEIARTDDDIALGGVRNPLVDVPVAATTGEPPAGKSNEDVRDDICLLFGTTTTFDKATLLDRYGSADEYVKQFRASAAKAVAAGFLLQADADKLIAEAEANRKLFA